MGADQVQGRMGQRVRTLRMIARVRQEDIADSIGVSKTTINNWELGKNEVSAIYYGPIARTFGITVVRLVEGLEKDPSYDTGEWAINVEADMLRPEVKERICRDLFREMSDRESRARDHLAASLGAPAFAMA